MSEPASNAPSAPDPHELTARYFDGELAADDEPEALAHLASCARCQEELGDFIGLDFALREGGAVAEPVASDAAAAGASRATASAAGAASSGAAPPRAGAAAAVAVTSLDEARARAAGRKRRGAVTVVLTAVAAAAAALAFWWGRGAGPGAAPGPLALAPTRAVEARFTARAFAVHRPYSVARSGNSTTRESFSLESLARLERRGERDTLAAAQAAAGELGRARAALQSAPASAARDADLAALELLAGQPEAALEAARRALARAPSAPAALWNRALALRDLELPLVAAAELERVAALGEPGWAAEARERAASLRAAMAARGPRATAFAEAGRAMIARTGPPLGATEVAERPGLTRLYFYDALRSAGSAQEARALAPLAEALDRAAGNALAQRALERVSGADFAERGPLALQYRELALGRSADEGAALLARLARGRTWVDDLRLGAILLAGRAQERLPELARLIESTRDPWFLLYLPLERATAHEHTGATDLAESELRAAQASCDQRLWAHRCAHLAWRLAQLYMGQGRYVEAEAQARLAGQAFRASGAPELEDVTLTRLAEIRRGLGRLALAAATFEEVRARLGDRDCSASRYAAAGQAMISIYRDVAFDERLLTVDACGEVPGRFEVGMMVDLALMSGRPADRARAERWIAAARQGATSAPPSPGPSLALIAEVAQARLDVARAPAAEERLRTALTELAAPDEETTAFRAWVVQALVSRAAARGAWGQALAIIAEDLRVPVPERCALAVSLDDTRGVAIAVGADGRAAGATPSVEAPPQWQRHELVPRSLRAGLTGCAHIAVLARSPLHGRADLLPPELPWAFVGPRAAASSPPPSTRALYVGDALPPVELGLPALAPLRAPAGAVALRGPAATPSQVLATLSEVGYAELHVHGRVDLGVADASFLALSPGADQRWALTAADVRKAKLASAPVVVLAACRAATVAPYEHRRWSLPDAFLEAGARAVIAPTVEIPDAEASAFFAEVRGLIARGDPPAVALSVVRKVYLARGQAWAGQVVLFE